MDEVGLKKILFLTTIDFWNSTNTGGKMISKRNYDMLVSIFGQNHVYYVGIGNAVNLYKEEKKCTFPTKEGNVTAFYNFLFNRYTYGKKEEKQIVQYVNELDPELIFFDGTWLGGLIYKFQNKSLKKLLVYYHDVESNVTYKRIFKTGRFRPYVYIKYKCVKYNERIITKKADYCICMNQRDNAILNRYFHRQADFFLPTTIKDTYYSPKLTPKSAETVTLLFVGIFFLPTIHGLNWFIKQVLPYIECELVVVGREMEKYRPPIHTEKLKIIGTVKDLSDYYEQADAVVCPIFIGDGMKTKTAEAMMYGKTIFATDEALEGYEVEGVKGIYRCNEANEFIEKIQANAKSSERCKYNESVRKCFLEKYEFNARLSEFKEWIYANGLLEET